MRAYYGSRLSPNQTETPEGFLICLNVPIARTGMQTYLRSELGFKDDPNGLVDIIRTEEEVFSPATIASFEGKPVAEDHPPVEITPDNISAYYKGHVQNVHRGSGYESDLLIADLYVTSPPLIEAIKNGRLREISCGYDCEYIEDEQGHIFQRGIRGNHVAVVSAGRAGPRVAIKDSELESKSIMERGTKSMAKKTNSLLSRMFAGWAKDADPQEVADAIEEIASNASDNESEVTPTTKPAPASSDCNTGEAKDGGEFMQQVLTALTGLTEKIEALLKTVPAHKAGPMHKETTAPASAPSSDEDELTKLEDEIESNPGTLEDQEESRTVPADDLSEPQTEDEEEVTVDEDGPVTPINMLPENPIPGADRALALATIKAIRPIIAKLPAGERKAAADAAARQIRKAIGRDAQAHTNGYVSINQIMRQKAKAKDSSRIDRGELGRNIMASRNPHYKKS